MTLSIYLARRFLRAFGMVLGVFLGILYLIDMVEQVRRFGGASLSFGDLAVLSALNVPGALYTILPLIMVLSGVTLFLGLARTSELVVIRAAGRSALRMLAAPVLVALVLGAVAVGFGNPIVAATQKRYETLSDNFSRGGAQAVSIGREGVWLRQGNPERGDATGIGQTVIHAGRANLDATTLYDVRFLIFAPEAGPMRRIDAAEARLMNGQWHLRAAKDWPLTGANPERAAVWHDNLTLASDLTPERIRDSFGTPSAIPVWDLPKFIAGLERAGFSAQRHQVWLQMELALPLVLAAMLLLAAGFTMRHVRFGGTGVRVLLALAAGLGIFFLRNFAQVLGDNGQIPVALAAWAPPAVALMLALALLLHLEDG
ncbi:LPS export ABC transporter permease LptG [Candidatus Falkowbacteria bacterium]|nr:LPS export ABC transporter permease LptG [Candidatus Falkowbacteria bacterium]